jgi:uncharacterized protein (DUF305 family)
MKPIRTLLLGLVAASAIAGVAAADMHQHGATSHGDVTTFSAVMDAAMARMHYAMRVVKPTGNPDRDFAAMMIPHHQGAIDMAEIELRFGTDERLRRLAQGIIVEQRQVRSSPKSGQ